CQGRPSLCQPGHCENVPGGYRCSCPIGYQPNPLGTLYVDECLQSPPPCGSGRCENVPGGYRCLCPAGFRASLTENQCLDIDECAAAGSPCGPQGLCLNTEGSFRCQCARGYRTEGVGGTSCVGECHTSDEHTSQALGPSRHRLAALARTVPTRLSPLLDVNECLEGDFCFPRGECLNTEGSYTCLCAQGFTAAPDRASCEGKCPAVSSGGALSACQGGDEIQNCCGVHALLTSPLAFADIDECLSATVCTGGHCANTEGSFDCYCPPGTRSTPSKASCEGEWQFSEVS
uniref:EGF-like domain-containing protein n=1 Tax=Pseudonaja textilis TaxID=8673 RepID=A0A670ZRQ8_PSETE